MRGAGEVTGEATRGRLPESRDIVVDRKGSREQRLPPEVPR